MYHIGRNQFCEQDLDWPQLSRWCDTWLGWRRIALGPHAPLGLFRVEIEIQCIPTAELANEATRWNERLPKALFEPAQIVGSDTIRLVGRNQLVREKNALDDVGQLVLTCETEGRPVKTEFVAHVPSNNPRLPSNTDHLVLYGLARGGVFELKAMWGKKLPYDDGSMWKFVQWNWEPLLLEGFRKRDQVERQLAFATGDSAVTLDSRTAANKVSTVLPRLAPGIPIFVDGSTVKADVTAEQMALAVSYAPMADELSGGFSADAVKFSKFYIKAKYGYKETFGGFLLRCGIAAAFALVGAYSCRFQLFELRNGMYAFWAGVVALFWIIGYKTRWVLYRWKRMRAGLKAVNEQPLRFTIIRELDSDWASNPAVRKLAEDMKSIGAQHFLDLIYQIPSVKKSLARYYYIPEARTYFAITFILQGSTLHDFPANVIYLVKTLYADDSSVITMNSTGGAAKNLNPKALCARYPGITDAKEMLQKHLALLATYRTSAAGPLTLNEEEFIARLHEDHRNNAERKAKYGYYRLSDSLSHTFRGSDNNAES